MTEFSDPFIQFPSALSGIILLIGQVTDGLATPLVGILSDHGKCCCIQCQCLYNYGRRKLWHLIGMNVMKGFQQLPSLKRVQFRSSRFRLRRIILPFYVYRMSRTVHRKQFHRIHCSFDLFRNCLPNRMGGRSNFPFGNDSRIDTH